MKIAYITTYNAGDGGKWSGIGNYMARCLREQAGSLDFIGDLKAKYGFSVRGKGVFYKHLLRKKYLPGRSPYLLRNYAEEVSSRLSKSGADIIFSPGTVPIARLKQDKPVVFWTDSTFRGMIDLFPDGGDICKESVKDGDAMERAALETCAMAIYSSDWAARTAIENYGADEVKVKVVPFGANLNTEMDISAVRSIIEARSRTKCKLLFLAVDWKRKGGDTALKVSEELNKSGLDTELLIVGCHPEIKRLVVPEYVRSFGFIDKSSAGGEEKIKNFLKEAHFLILPSRIDYSPIAFCEANAFGVPCLSTNVGGIATIIKDGVNGKVFPREAGINEYCAFISDIFANYARYQELAVSSFGEYRSRLNWATAGQTVKKLLKGLLEK